MSPAFNGSPVQKQGFYPSIDPHAANSTISSKNPHDGFVDDPTAAVRGRCLAARPETAVEEWGVSARVAYAPAPAGRGPGFSVAPTWGAVEREADAAWNDERWWESVASARRAESGGSKGWTPTGVQVRVDHGVYLRGRRMLLTPWTEAGFEDGGLERLRVGATMRMPPRSEGGGPELETFIESGDGGKPTGVMLRGRVRF